MSPTSCQTAPPRTRKPRIVLGDTGYGKAAQQKYSKPNLEREPHTPVRTRLGPGDIPPAHPATPPVGPNPRIPAHPPAHAAVSVCTPPSFTDTPPLRIISCNASGLTGLMR
jgi:hypothetical protein